MKISIDYPDALFVKTSIVTAIQEGIVSGYETNFIEWPKKDGWQMCNFGPQISGSVEINLFEKISMLIGCIAFADEKDDNVEFLFNQSGSFFGLFWRPAKKRFF